MHEFEFSYIKPQSRKLDYLRTRGASKTVKGRRWKMEEEESLT